MSLGLTMAGRVKGRLRGYCSKVDDDQRIKTLSEPCVGDPATMVNYFDPASNSDPGTLWPKSKIKVLPSWLVATTRL